MPATDSFKTNNNASVRRGVLALLVASLGVASYGAYNYYTEQQTQPVELYSWGSPCAVTEPDDAHRTASARATELAPALETASASATAPAPRSATTTRPTTATARSIRTATVPESAITSTPSGSVPETTCVEDP
eukprot:CAMPEP_0170478882 /NCGR_PEP_ID=MMETSP0208-20121228/314_1 /TAXON_ID=197538 /ORGANISM="Strombidium inclinatum, Strain S3" /LENGTH=133 /DNA_ID=CAMNT_0010751211 /DNA_START=27 /DNA_END=429 /DNA_ORIENTATION=-